MSKIVDWLILFVIKRLLVRFGLTDAEAADLTPKVISVVGSAVGVFKEVAEKNPKGALARISEISLKPRAMTPEEEKIWMDRAGRLDNV